MGGAWEIQISSGKERMTMTCSSLSLLPASSYRTSLYTFCGLVTAVSVGVYAVVTSDRLCIQLFILVSVSCVYGVTRDVA